MTEVLIILSILLFLVVFKFIYDTYFTNNTDRRFEEYRNLNPIDAAKIEPPRTEKQFTALVGALVDEIPHPNENKLGKDEGRAILAKEWRCKVEDVRKEFFKDLKKRRCNTYTLTCFVSQFDKQKVSDSIKYGLDPENTPGAILKELTEEYLSMCHDDFYFKRAQELANLGFKVPHIQRLIDLQLEDFPDKEKVIREVLLKDQPAELLRLKAIDSIYDDNDCKWALHLIDKGLALKDSEAEPKLMALRDEVTKMLEKQKSGKAE